MPAGDESDFARSYARDVRVDPVLNGADNVQDAIAGVASAPVGTLVQAAANDTATADSATPITYDGSNVDLACIVAAPPDWMDNAGNIISAGMYQACVEVDGNVAPTTPGLYLTIGFGSSKGIVPADALATVSPIVAGNVFNLGPTDVPFATDNRVVSPTDITGTATGQSTIIRLATITT